MAFETNKTRRNMLRAALLGASAVGLRSLVTGLPRSFFETGSIAYAADPESVDYLIISNSQGGDPINTNAPGTYVSGTEHNPSALLSETQTTFGSTMVTAAKPWADLSEDLRARMAFIHHKTYTNAHPEMSKVLAGHGAVTSLESNTSDQFPSVLSRYLAECLSTIQSEPATIGDTPLTFQSRPLDLVKPTELQGLFNAPEDLQATLRAMRDAELDLVYNELRTSGSIAQRAFLDRYALGREQARQIGADLGALLTRVPVEDIDANGGRDQVIAAVALLKLNIAPVISVGIPFGGDNHADDDLSVEATQTVSGAATIQLLWDELKAAGIQDRTTFATLNVFGRTLKRTGGGGRNHNGDHHTMCLFGPRVQGGVAGGIEPSGKDFGATGIDSATGAASASGDITPDQSLESAFRTLGVALGVSSETLNGGLAGGKVIQSVLV